MVAGVGADVGGAAAARPNAASGPCKAIALGWTEYEGEWDWLAQFATKVKATPYTDWLWKDINKLQWWDEFEYLWVPETLS